MSQVAVITGVAGGVGGATAAVFRDAGWTVVGIDRRQPGPDVPLDEFHQADVAEVDAASAVFGSFDVDVGLAALVNNAAIHINKSMLETSSQEWDLVLATNLRAPFLAIQAAHRLMRPGAAIVNVASVHAHATSGGLAAYAASKGGLVALTRAAALELAGDGIRVNAVLPGAVDTPMLRAGFERVDGPGMKELVARTPAGRVASPREIGEAILFLCDAQKSGFVTGQTLTVDGGALARLSTE